MRRRIRYRAAAAALALLLLPVPPRAELRDQVQQALHDASVAVGTECAGVVAESPDFVFTAAECVRGHDSLEVTFADGATGLGWVIAADRISDQALLVLEEPAPVTPLTLARRRPFAGMVLYYAGHPEDARFREVKLQRVAREPSLPGLQHALFTALDGTTRNAGAPIVDGAARVVALVHDGMRAQVGTPAHTLRRLVEKVLSGEAVPRATDG
jgi:hypothetical protein